MAKHLYNEILSTALVGDPAVLVSLETGLVSEKMFSGQPYSRFTCVSPNAGGEPVYVTIPGATPGLNPAEVARRVASVDFIRVKFIGLTCEVKGDQYNKVTYTGTAAKAEVVTAPPAPGSAASKT